MIVTHRGHEIEVTRERCLGGWSQIYYSIFRQSDGYECLSGHSDTEDTVRDFVGFMKDRIDYELLQDDPWCERKNDVSV